MSWLLTRTDGRYYAGNGRWLASPADALTYDSKADAHYAAAHMTRYEAETTGPAQEVKRVTVKRA